MDDADRMNRFRQLGQIPSIIAALRRHKMASALIVLQIALTLAVVSNALFIVKTRLVHLSRPTGTDEAHLFVIRNGWTDTPSMPDIDARIRADLGNLRQLAGVRDAFASDGYPFGTGGRLARVRLRPEHTKQGQLGLIYAADEHAIDTFGIALVEGRNFRADEVSGVTPYDTFSPAVCIITRDLASKLFPHGGALGRTVYLLGDSPTVIVGVLDRLEGQYVGSTTRSIDEDSILVPVRAIDPAGGVYIVRVVGGQLGAVMRAAPAALFARDRQRTINADDGVISLSDARKQGYATDRGLAITMTVVCLMLLLATAGGIVGLSSFWVSQRRKHIGVRRALGATRGDILRYFQIENFLIVGIGIVLGAALAVAANLGLMTQREFSRMPLWVIGIGALLLWLLGQLAVWGPARRAAAVPPVEATRSV
jgi:putative ABC transport system permease protein